jgi:hypothetical protein
MTTATSTIPNPATWGPRRYEDDLDPIEVRELAITAGERRVHVIQNDDLGVIIGRGQKDQHVDDVPHNVEDAGLVVVSLSVDGGDHDEVHYSCGFGLRGRLELLSSAIETLTLARDTLLRVSKA